MIVPIVSESSSLKFGDFDTAAALILNEQMMVMKLVKTLGRVIRFIVMLLLLLGLNVPTLGIAVHA